MMIQLRSFPILALLLLPFLTMGQEKSSDATSKTQSYESGGLDLTYRECTSHELATIKTKGLTVVSKTSTGGDQRFHWSDGLAGELKCSGATTKIVYSQPGLVGHGSLCIACFQDNKVVRTDACRELPAGFWK
ncbi:MAG: hypothetical protein KA479_14060 [Saprospiraceae bacterium]|nr:hypothetical protein [Saprospiraceae bacterium]